MYRMLEGLRIVEAASFVAGPSCGLHCAQLGAEVIRIDPLGGGPDFHRWPVTQGGASLYWEGLNKGKKSITIDFTRPAGRELVQRLAAAPGVDGGLFVTNFPAEGFLSHARLAALRADIITLRIMGWGDGSTAVDYTVNAALGVPLLTGPAALGAAPVNSVLPAWDLLAGSYGAFTLLAAERARRQTGAGAELRLPLGDLASAMLGHLGQIAEVRLAGADRPRDGNALFGAFGRDFATRDGQRIMLVALTRRQWRDAVKALQLGPPIGELESALGVDFGIDESLRYRHREALFPLFETAIGGRDLADLAAAFEATGVCWSPYRSVHGASLAGDRFGLDTAVMSPVDHPSGARYPTPGAAVSVGAQPRGVPAPAPVLGADTDLVLAEVLRLDEGEIGRLHDAGLVGA